MANDIVVDIAFKGNGPDFLAELSRAVGRAKTQMQELGQSTAQLSRLENTLARMSTQANQFAGSAGKAAQATAGWSQKWTPFKGQFLEAEAASKKLWGSIDSGIASAEKSLARGTKAAQDFQDAQSRKTSAASSSAAMGDWDKQFKALSVAADENVRKLQQAKRAVEDYQNSLSNARYVLYDVAGTLTIMGAGLVVPLAAATSVAIEFEKQFAQVARTSGLAGEELGKLKTEFDELYGSIPITYDALAKIATLAGQLGVPAGRIAAFTEVVAKTSAVTDLSVEQAATAFGRLDALIPNVRGQYERLGSAIAKVGVNSVATESEIVSISTQISSMGAFAGLTAQDIIGLSGALASVGAQPELSRGTVTRTFTLMSRAVAANGTELNKFAEVAGVSSETFRKAWGTDQFGQVFLKFMSGIKDEGGNAVAVLNDLGITSVRDVPLLLRLANAADSTGKAGALLAQTIGDANTGWAENIELQRQYEIIAGTVAAKIEVLVNNFNLFLQALGGPMLGSLGDLVDLLTDLTKIATDFVQTDLGGAVARIALVLSAMLGVLALAAGAMALMGASSIGVYQALLFLQATAPKAAAGLLGTAGAAALADGSLKAGAASALAFSRALKAISIVGAIMLLPDVFQAINSELLKMRGVDISSATGSLKELATSADPLANYFRNNGSIVKGFAADIANSFTGIGVTAKAANQELLALASGGDFKGIADSLNAFDKAAKGVDANRALEMFPDVVAAAKEAGVELDVVGGKIVVVGEAAAGAGTASDQLAQDLAAVEAEAAAAEGTLQEMKDILDQIAGTQMSAAAAADTLQRSVNDAWTSLNNGEFALYGTDNAAIAFRETLRGMETDARAAGRAVAENGGSTEEAVAAWQLGRDQIINMRVAMGESREAATLWADENLGSAEEVVNAMAGVAAAIEAIPTSHRTELYVTTGSAYADIEDFKRAFNSIPTYKGVTIETIIGNPSMGGGALPRKAQGGSVWGAGTATSDSILAKLSNGEFVIRAAAAKAIGYGKLDHANRFGKLPAFAGGGQVGGGGGQSMMSGEIDLGPRTMRALSRQVVNMIAIDQDSIATASTAGNARSAWRGGRR